MSKVWNDELAKFPPNKGTEEEVQVRLRRLFPEEVITIGPTDGSKTIFGASNVFKYIDPDFKRLDVASIATLATDVAVFEMVSFGTSAETFGSLGGLIWLCLTQSQIAEFCSSLDHYLSPFGPTSFLFEGKREFFSALVRVRDGGEKEVLPFSLKDGVVRSAVGGPRIVVPALQIRSTAP